MNSPRETFEKLSEADQKWVMEVARVLVQLDINRRREGYAMNTWLAKIDPVKFKTVLVRNGMSIKRVSIDADVARSTVQNAISGHGVRPETLGRIAAALGVDASEITADADHGTGMKKSRLEGICNAAL